MFLVVPLTFLFQSQIKSLIRFHMDTVRPPRMQCGVQRHQESSFLTGGLTAAVKYVMDMHHIQMCYITMVHIIRKHAPTFLHGFHAFIMLSNSSGGSVSIPSSLASATIPSIK